MPRPGPRTTNKYSDQFKATAVRLSELPALKCRTSRSRFTSIRSCCLVGARKHARDGS